MACKDWMEQNPDQVKTEICDITKCNTDRFTINWGYADSVTQTSDSTATVAITGAFSGNLQETNQGINKKISATFELKANSDNQPEVTSHQFADAG